MWPTYLQKKNRLYSKSSGGGTPRLGLLSPQRGRSLHKTPQLRVSVPRAWLAAGGGAVPVGVGCPGHTERTAPHTSVQTSSHLPNARHGTKSRTRRSPIFFLDRQIWVQIVALPPSEYITMRRSLQGSNAGLLTVTGERRYYPAYIKARRPPPAPRMFTHCHRSAHLPGSPSSPIQSNQTFPQGAPGTHG